jgi:hypothetical protein
MMIVISLPPTTKLFIFLPDNFFDGCARFPIATVRERPGETEK